MKLSLPFWGPNLTDPAQRRACSCRFIPVVIFMCLALSVGRPYILDYKQRLSSAWGTINSIQIAGSSLCKGQYKPLGSENLPEGIISRTSNLELQPLFGSIDSPISQGHAKEPRSLLAIAAGIKQKNVVDLIVQKFFSSNFTIMLFHYDGAVDGWRDLNWSDSALHVSAINQTKWWFAKRFLHPDIVAVYDYIFLWDEDLGVEHFNPGRYISIIEKERLMISQPALDTSKSVAHYQITGRLRKGNVHRRVYKYSGGLRCYGNSTAPPCTGWVEMMAPVFSRVAWRCVWHMIQNDLIHAWGLDKKLGYCAQGDRTKNVGVVDSEYIVHLGIPTLGGSVKDGVSVEIRITPLETLNFPLVKSDVKLTGVGELQVPISSLSGKTVGLYFSAHKCPPCTKFTSRLAPIYNTLKEKNEDFEIVFVSLDRDEDGYLQCFNDMPWLALPFTAEFSKSLSRYFDIKRIPALVIIGPDGKTVTREGRNLINLHLELAFPFTEAQRRLLKEKMDEEAKSYPSSFNHVGHRHVLNLVSENSGGGPFICCECDEQGLGWAYQCLGCGYEIHLKCVRESEGDNAEKKQVPSVDSFCALSNRGV